MGSAYPQAVAHGKPRCIHHRVHQKPQEDLLFQQLYNLSPPLNEQSHLSSCSFLSRRLRMDHTGLLDEVGRGAEK